ncbi:bactofilin family protein [Mucisphaera calidilacus]|uniref:BacA-like protein n=1 Tax=Mucisphaera calidilacus TaxID=2527982 RepID=A0A518BY97_9BACT|nr:polymer-forming cytoskeletal protein [Mucisphaera calidilacus]QDU71950.1 BacA-like protein [Mucisphaera calidilacus]
MSSDASTQNRTVLGADCSIAGDLSIDNDATLLGQFEGELRVSRSLEIGGSARARGTIMAGAVMMSGEAEAVIIAEQVVHLLPGCRVKGRIFAPQLQVEEGAMFDGELCVSPNAIEAAESHMKSSQASARPSMHESAPGGHDVQTVPSAVATLLERRRQQQSASEAQAA